MRHIITDQERAVGHAKRKVYKHHTYIYSNDAHQKAIDGLHREIAAAKAEAATAPLYRRWPDGV